MIKSSFHKNRFIIFPLLFIIVVLAVVLVLEERKPTYGQIGTVDGIPISSKLFSSKLIKDRTKKKALDDCVRIIVQQELAIKYGIIDDADYKKILKDCELENKKRKQDMADGKPIYGPVEYSPDDYFNYVFTNMITKLKTKLGESEFKVDDTALERMYEAQKDDQFKLVSIRINRISLPVTDEKGNVDPVKRQEAGEKIEDILKRIKAGERFEELAKAANRDGTVMERVFDTSTKHMDSRINPELRETAEGMSPNQVSDIIMLEDSSLNIIKCEEYKIEGDIKFDDVKENIRSWYIDTKYDEYKDQLIRNARVDIDPKAYGAQ